MDTQTMIADARSTIGPVGAKIPSVGISDIPPIAERRAAVRRFEAAGYGCAWNGEGVGAKDAFVELAVLLASTERMAFSSSIANMWARPAETTHGAAVELSSAFPGRFVLGIGVGYPFQAEQLGQSYAKPVARMREYLARLEAPSQILTSPERNYVRLLAANGPAMVALAAEAADGAIPTMTPSEHIAEIRAALGPDKLLVAGLTVIPDDDEERAAQAARAMIGSIARFPGSPYIANLRRQGFTQEDLENGADHVLDALYGYGSNERIAAKVRKHLDAGADHVILTPIVPDFIKATEQLLALEPVVREIVSGLGK